GTAHNPLCGDEVELTLALGEGKITRVGVRVRGCAIAQAAASLMSEIVPGWSLEDARDALAPLKTFLEGKTDHLPRAMEPLLVLEAIRKNTSRLNCALLGWQAFQSGTLTPTPEK
ncbi:MAG: iron-sulfur cluster assembly scaffold protein, partial [Deltaproteobacteria bacterium]|nr:iron-sulfur cluster assembly scaffold protein [Deltaproteobacteria bacterium]